MATRKAIFGSEDPEEEAALLIQKSFRGLIGRQAFAHKLLLHERGKRKSSRKPAMDVPKSTLRNTGDSVPIVQLAKKGIAKPLPQTRLTLRNVSARNNTDLDDSLVNFHHQRNLTGITEIDEDIVRDSLSGTKSVAATLLSSKNRSTKPLESPRESYVRDSLDDNLFLRGRVADDGDDERLEDSLEFRSCMRNLPSGARSSATSESTRELHSGTIQQKATRLGADPAVAESDAGDTIQQRSEGPQFNAPQVCAPSKIPVRSTSQPRGSKRQSTASTVLADGSSQGQVANEQLHKLKQLYELDVRSGMQEQLQRNELDKVNCALVGRSLVDGLQGSETRAGNSLHPFAESNQITNRRAVYGQAQYGQARAAPTSSSRDRTDTDEQHAAERSDGQSKLELQRRILEQENLLRQKEEEQQQMQRQLEQQQKQHQRQRDIEYKRLREQQEREREEQAQHQRLAEEQQAREQLARERQAREQQARERRASELQAGEQQAREQQRKRERERLRRDRDYEVDLSHPSDIQQQRPQRPQLIKPQEQHPNQQLRRLQSQNSDIKHAQQLVQARPDRGQLDSHLGQSSELEQLLLRDLAQLTRQQQKLHNLLDAHQRPSAMESPRASGDSVSEESKIRQHQRAGDRANDGKDKEKDKEKKAFGWGARDFRGKGQVEGNAIKKPSGPNTEAASRPVDAWRAAVRSDSDSQAQGLQKQHNVQAQRAEPQNSCPPQRPLPDSPNSDKGYEVTHFAQKHYAVLHLEQGAGYLTEFQRKQQHQQQKQLRVGSAPRGGAVSGCDGSVVSADNARLFRKGAGFGIPLPAEQASLSARKANDIESRSLPPIPQASHRRPEPNEAFVHPLGANRRVGSRSSTRSAPS